MESQELYYFSFYIVLHGKVAIYINNAISDEDDVSKIVDRLRDAEKAAQLTNGRLDRTQFGNYIAPISK